MRTVTLPTPGSSTGRDEADFVVADDIQTVVWLANLAALELHVPQWRIGLSDNGKDPQADLIVFDLDPGPGATIVECCDVALALRELLSHYGLEGWPKTSGNKGMHLYVPIEPASSRKTSAFAKQLAEQLAEALPENVTANMTKALRPGKVFIDWSQNASAKTTLAPYSLRGVRRAAGVHPDRLGRGGLGHHAGGAPVPAARRAGPDRGVRRRPGGPVRRPEAATVVTVRRRIREERQSHDQ